ncbi:hypothetical protein K439DRAFT_1302970, partial [Ramaria rubella]
NERTEWIRRKMQGRRTSICFDDYQSETYDIDNGCDQGCPLSVLFYNAALLEVAEEKAGELTLGFIDDVNLLAEGDTF